MLFTIVYVSYFRATESFSLQNRACLIRKKKENRDWSLILHQRSALRLCSLCDNVAEDNLNNNVLPIQEESSLSAVIQTMRSTKKFQHLPDDAISVIPRDEENSSHPLWGEDVVPINTIVVQLFLEDLPTETALVILSKQDKIDMRKLTAYWKGKRTNLQRVELAPSEMVETLVGYTPGSIPPIGHTINLKVMSIPTVLDESLLQNTPRRQLLGGGGSDVHRTLVRLPSLVAMDHVEIASIGVNGAKSDDESIAEDNDYEISTLSRRQISLPKWGSASRPKPLFPVETPGMEEAKALLATEPSPDLPLLDATWVSMVGKIGSVRRMSRRLVFCDLLPPGFEYDEENDSTDEDELVLDHVKPWRSAVDGEDLSVQLIGGSTLCQAMGEVHGQAALKRLQPGKFVLIQAKINTFSTRDSLEPWVANRRLDLRLVSFQILHDTVASSRTQDPAVLSTPTSLATPNKPFLRLNDVLPDATNNDEFLGEFVRVVDDSQSIQEFSGHITGLLRSLSRISVHVNGDDVTPMAPIDQEKFSNTTMKYDMVGMDCEWEPHFYLSHPQERQPVLTLQISVQDHVYILDMQSLARPFLSAESSLTPEERSLNDVLEKLFTSKTLFKVGFQLIQDLQKLAVSYPHIPAFQSVFGVIEASTLAVKVIRSLRQRNSKLITSSLNRLTEHFLDRSVNKEQQVSDWAQRPLTKQQIEYAALDALITATLVKQFFKTLQLHVYAPGPDLGRWKGDASFMRLLTSHKFLLLQPETDVHVIKKLKAKPAVTGCPLLVVTQTWMTSEGAPKLPSVPENDNDGPYTDVHGILQVPSTVVSIRPAGLSESDFGAFVLSLVGQKTGKSKDKCLTTLLGAALAREPNILPDDARLKYPARSGYIEFDDGVALFVNMPEKCSGAGQPRSFPNEWLDDGKVLTWFIREFEWERGKSDLARKVLDPDSLVVLFVRNLNKSFFLCCGPCEVQESPKLSEIVSKEKQDQWDLVQLNLKLLEWEKLKTSNEFLSLVF